MDKQCSTLVEFDDVSRYFFQRYAAFLYRFLRKDLVTERVRSQKNLEIPRAFFSGLSIHIRFENIFPRPLRSLCFLQIYFCFFFSYYFVTQEFSSNLSVMLTPRVCFYYKRRVLKNVKRFSGISLLTRRLTNSLTRSISLSLALFRSRSVSCLFFIHAIIRKCNAISRHFRFAVFFFHCFFCPFDRGK